MTKLSKNQISYLNHLATNGPHIPRISNRRTRLALVKKGLVEVKSEGKGSPVLVYLTGEGRAALNANN